ncbi:MAG: TMEM198/TM7SF3 family protein [Lachnospiraceae bacterium]|nr:TMEM198/TM7SF3 family protein [Lachnospiraceae bacterium]
MSFGGLSGIMDFLGGLVVIAVIPMLINCFFGYKILKFMITLGGACVGALLGALIGVFCGGEIAIVLFAILLAILCGFIAFKLYKLGIFLQFWLLGTVLFAALFLIMGYPGAVGFGVVLGLIVGVLAVVLHKGFVIITTAFSGGMVAGLGIGAAFGAPIGGSIVIGITLFVFGMIVQFAMEKKKAPKTSYVSEDVVVPSREPDVQMVDDRPVSKVFQDVTEPIRSNPIYTELSKVTPNYYCPKSKVLIDAIILSKDNEGKAYLKVDFRNIGDSALAAIYFKVKGYGIAGESLGEKDYNLIDLNVASDSEFSFGEIELFNGLIRRVEIIIMQTVNSNYEVTRFEDSDTLEIPDLTLLSDSVDNDMAELLELKSDEKYLFKPLDADLWMCTCGHIGYHRCSHCGRDKEDSLKDTEAAVITRITDNINKLLSETESCKALNELNERKSKLERVLAILTANAFSEELLNSCRSALKDIELKINEKNLRTKKTKDRVKKGIILVPVCAAVIALFAIAAKVVIGLPPSERRIKSDTKKYVAERIGNDYEVEDFKIDKDTANGNCNVTVEVKAKHEKNDDELDVTVYLTYVKWDDRYEYTDGSNTTGILYPNHQITEQDDFPVPEMLLIYDGGSAYIDKDSIGRMKTDGRLRLEYEIDYEEIDVTDNKAEVPMMLHVDYLNAATDEEIVLSYTYCGDYGWYINSSQEIQLKPKSTILNESIINQLISGASIDYKGEKLSGEFITIDKYEPDYSEGFTKAELASRVTWDNSIVKVDGTVEAEFVYKNSVWQLSNIRFADVSNTARYTEVTDAEIIDIISRIISEKCNERTNVSNIAITSRSDGRGTVTLVVNYDSESEYFLLNNSITVVLKESILEGYTFETLKEQLVTMAEFKEEKQTEVIEKIVMIAEGYQSKTNVSNVAIISKEYSSGGIAVGVEFDSEEGYYQLRKSVDVTMKGDIRQSDGSYTWIDESIKSISVKEELNKEVAVNYKLSCDNATPNGVPSEGYATLRVDTYSNGDVRITGQIGSLYINLSGSLTYPNNDITINHFEEKVYVAYKFIFNSNSDITFRVKPSLAYCDGRLTGRILYDSVAIGVGEFTIYFE